MLWSIVYRRSAASDTYKCPRHVISPCTDIAGKVLSKWSSLDYTRSLRSKSLLRSTSRNAERIEANSLYITLKGVSLCSALLSSARASDTREKFICPRYYASCIYFPDSLIIYRSREENR